MSTHKYEYINNPSFFSLVYLHFSQQVPNLVDDAWNHIITDFAKSIQIFANIISIRDFQSSPFLYFFSIIGIRYNF